MATTDVADMLSPPEDDEREIAAEELSTLCAIFPEIVIDQADPFTAFLDLPVIPQVPIQISFTNEAIVAAPDAQIAPAAMEIHNLAYLPPLRIKFSLPIGYPAMKPPQIELSTNNPAWLPSATINNLQEKAERLWEDVGHDQVLFTYIDMLQEASSSDTFGVSSLDVSQGDKIALLDFDIKAKKEKFNKETFDCGVCLDPKKGSVCHRMIDCGHVFCVQCLQDFYTNAITTGDLATVKCLTPKCANERDAKATETESKLPSDKRKPIKSKTFISPNELLQIPLDRGLVKRYVDLKHKSDLETDKNTVYCPRKWCQGGSRSKKHRKPEGLEILDGDSESESEDDNLMRICEDCSFAFCSRCYQSWHGEYYNCKPKTDEGKELTAEDKATIEYIENHSTSCPTCSARSQKSMGCNHMICFKCSTHFCYLCSSWLAPENPYRHYNIEHQYCYMRLWELEGGDGTDIAPGLAENRQPEALGHAEEVNVVEPAPRRPPRRRERQPVAPVAGLVIARHVREGPLILRIEQNPAPAAEQNAAPHVHPPPAQPPPAMNGRQAAGVNQRPPRRQRNVPVPDARREPENINLQELGQNREWLDRFVELAMNDEEDNLDSDEGDDHDWEILPR